VGDAPNDCDHAVSVGNDDSIEGPDTLGSRTPFFAVSDTDERMNLEGTRTRVVGSGIGERARGIWGARWRRREQRSQSDDRGSTNGRCGDSGRRTDH
jgi:hypothetical protein